MNRFQGIVTSVESDGGIALIEVQVGDISLSATILGTHENDVCWSKGQTVQIAFKETEVALAKQFAGEISLRNRLPGVIAGIEFGKILTSVEFDCPNFRVKTIITTRSAMSMRLAIGQQVVGLVKSNEMSLELCE